MPTDFEQIKRLPPETKVIELRRLIDNLRKHIDEHQKDIRIAENLLKFAEDEQKVIEQEAEKDEVKTAVRQEKKETPAPRKGQELEKLVKDENFEQRVRHLAEQPVSYLQREARQIYDSQRQTGIETREQRDRLYELSRGAYVKRKDIEEGRYKPGEQQKHLLTSTEQLLGSMYQGQERQQKQYRRTEE